MAVCVADGAEVLRPAREAIDHAKAHEHAGPGGNDERAQRYQQNAASLYVGQARQPLPSSCQQKAGNLAAAGLLILSRSRVPSRDLCLTDRLQG